MFGMYVTGFIVVTAEEGGCDPIDSYNELTFQDLEVWIQAKQMALLTK